jgi:hypothetical protein
LHRFLGRSATDFGTGAGAKALGDRGPSWMRRSAGEAFSACASVLATMKSTPSTCAAIMLAMALRHPA